jgi:Kef-type K+ transport system membrane component KefB
MSNAEIGYVILALNVLLLGAHLLGYLFEKLRQPRLIGEILAGILLGPFVLGDILPTFYQMIFGSAQEGVNKTQIILNFVYWAGLLLLMFISGCETRRLFSGENRKATAWIVGVGTPLPFFMVLGLGLASLLPLEVIVGTAGDRTAALLVLSIAVAVTSIPVISRIFYELGILQTRFASLILGSSVLEDIILWGVLAVATALVGSGSKSQQYLVGNITSHVAATVAYMGIGLIVLPRLLKKVHNSRWNLLQKASPAAYALFILFTYVTAASYIEVNLVFAAFLAGFGLMGGMNEPEREKYQQSISVIANFSSAFFIPIYFLLVGYKLVWGRSFSPEMVVVFLLGSSILCLLAVGLAARLAGFRGLDILNISFVCNARGGPGIVLASVAYDAGIINAAFYTTLVLTAIFTSQAAGIWLRWVLHQKWPLLSGMDKEETESIISVEEAKSA